VASDPASGDRRRSVLKSVKKPFGIEMASMDRCRSIAYFKECRLEIHRGSPLCFAASRW
jgi:hypothetical protein